MRSSPIGVDSIAVVGAGAAATALSVALTHSGVDIDCVYDRSPERAGHLAKRLAAQISSGALGDLRVAPSLLIVAVSDDAICDVADMLSRRIASWSGCTAMHLSGSLTSDALEPLRFRGAEVMSFHPMLPLHPDTDPNAFVGAWISVEGSPAAVELGLRLADVLGAHAQPVDPNAKEAIHVAAAIVSNFLVTLLSMGAEILSKTDLKQADYEALLRPLASATLKTVDFRAPAVSLTGPIARADLATVGRHLDFLSSRAPDLAGIYASMAAETVKIAAETGKIDPRQASGLLELLRSAVDPTGKAAERRDSSE